MSPASRGVADAETTHARPLSPGWWLQDSEGRVAVASWPNAALSIWIATALLGWSGLLGGEYADTLQLVGRGALLAWSLDEVVRGASPFRRVLGAVVFVLMLVRLFG